MKNEKYIHRTIELYFSGKLRTKYIIEKKRSQQDYAARSIDYSNPVGQVSKPNKEIENYIAIKTEAEQRASFLKLLIDEVEEALKVLMTENGKTEDEYNLLKWSYQRVPRYSDEEIAEKLDIHRNTVILRRNRILEELSGLINIDYYVNNPISEIAEFFRELLG